MIEQINIQPAAGLYYAYSAAIAFVKPIVVSVETTVYDLMDAEGNRACHYDAATGKVMFNNPFDGAQRVFIIYKTPNPLT